jgi:SNF2 family DNA or RNA helicase
MMGAGCALADDMGLGELWSLFHFLNPGLLLTKQAFVERFQGPEDQASDPGRQRS